MILQNHKSVEKTFTGRNRFFSGISVIVRKQIPPPLFTYHSTVFFMYLPSTVRIMGCRSSFAWLLKTVPTRARYHKGNLHRSQFSIVHINQHNMKNEKWKSDHIISLQILTNLQIHTLGNILQQMSNKSVVQAQNIKHSSRFRQDPHKLLETHSLLLTTNHT